MTRFSLASNGAPLGALAAVFSAAVMLTAGCGRSESGLEKKVLRCAKLEGASRSELPELVAVIDEIRASKTAPADLTLPPGDDASNAAAVLAEEFNDSTRLRLLPRLDELLEFERGRPSPTQVASMRELLLKEEPKLLPAAERAAERPRCASGVRFERGFFDRYELLDDAALATRLHLSAALVALDDGDRPAMLRQLKLAAKWVHWLAKEWRLEARLLAAQLRSQWLEVVALAVEKPAPAADYVTLYGVLRDQLQTWPPDRDSLVGDRAITLHAYEAIRFGLFDRVVTTDEKNQLDQAGWLDKLQAMDQPSIDADELFYLNVINEIIRGVDQPYFNQAGALASLLEQAAPDSPAGARAPLATRLFLLGVGDSVERLARDRAQTEAWLLALASAANFDLPPYRINPLNGRPYEATRDPEGVTLQLNDLHVPNPRVAIPSDLEVGQ